MTLFPEIQRRAQAEIDAVIGTDRLPTLDDFDNLPYIHAIAKEVTRWQPVAPLCESFFVECTFLLDANAYGMPRRCTAIGPAHLSTEDDEYNGHFIPKGSIVIANIW